MDEKKKCPNCGLTLHEWNLEKRIGCDSCIEVFQDEISFYLLKKGVYNFVFPANQDLKALIDKNIENENFEEAARLRDLLKKGDLFD
jgi:protein-arginine kinase activator protein McsA